MQDATSLTPTQLRSTTTYISTKSLKARGRLTRMQTPQLRQPHRPRTNMHMRRLLRAYTNLNTLHPRMLHHLINRRPHPRIRLQHLPDQTTTRPRTQIINRRGARRDRRGRIRTRPSISLIQRVRGGLGRAPRQLLEMQAVVHNPTGPDVDEPCIVG